MRPRARGPAPEIVAVLALAFAFAAACAEPDLGPCAIRCPDEGECPFGLSCREDGFCHASDDVDSCAASCIGCVSGGPYNYLFVSSELYIPGELGGLDGADAECARLATAADLPGEFRAYLSTESVDAASRLVTTAGDPANGWIRTDGRPVAATRDELLGGGIRFPPMLDENGNGASSEWVATGTDPFGRLALPVRNASDWTQQGDYYSGTPAGTTRSWGGPKYGFGYQEAHIYCVGIDHDRPLPLEPVTGRVAFLSRATFTPSSLAAADALCQAEADSLGLSEFRALLATSDEPAASRFDLSGPLWVRLDGIPWVEKAEDLATGIVLTSLNVDSSGDYVTFPNRIWAGATHPGASAGPSCLGWTSSAGEAITGVPNHGDSTFFNFDLAPCDAARPVYCLQR